MKFTLRDLFLATVIVAVCVAWWIDHGRRAREIQEMKEQLKEGEKALTKGGIF